MFRHAPFSLLTMFLLCSILTKLSRALAKMDRDPDGKPRAPRDAARRRRPLAERLNEIALRCATRPVLSRESEDEILGYDERGVPR